MTTDCDLMPMKYIWYNKSRQRALKVNSDSTVSRVNMAMRPSPVSQMPTHVLAKKFIASP